MPEIESAVAQGTFGGAPYGDRQEVTGPPEVTPITDTYREFLATDARSVLVTIQPHHQNFIKNPAWRVDATGWEVRQSILDEAVWRVDAASVDDPVNPTMLADLSGNGRDAVFGADAAAPVVLPWDGEDYVWWEKEQEVYPLAITTKEWDASAKYRFAMKFRLDAHHDVDSYAMIWQASVVGRTYINKDMTVTASLYHSGANYWAFTFPNLTVEYGVDYDLAWTYDPATLTVEYFVDGVSTGTEQVVDGNTWAPTQSSVTLYAGYASRRSTMRLYSLSVDREGDVQYVMDPSRVRPDYRYIENDGSQGGLWTIARADSGFKTAVVDRPLLLFAGGQYAAPADDGYFQSITEQDYTVLLRTRGFWTSAAGVSNGTMLSTKDVNVSGGNRGFIIRRQGTNLNAQAVHRWGTTGETDGTLYRQQYPRWDEDGEVWWMRVSGGMFDTVDTDQPPAAAEYMTGERSLWIGAGASANASNGEFEFLAAAIFDRALTDDEIQRASADLQAGYLSPSNTLDEENSWVGQSQVITESSTLRYVDTDKDGGSACIYIGPENDADASVSDRSDTSRASGEWTFSVYAKGSGRVRLRMDAYTPTTWGIAKSPPALMNLQQVSGDPESWAYSSSPVQDENGTVWNPKPGPFYTSIGQAVTGDPATLGLADVTPAVVQAPDGTVWTVNADPTAVPVFDLWGTPEEVAAPGTAWPDDNGGTHLEFIRGTDGMLWQQVSPDPGIPLDEDSQPIPPSEPAPTQWFYKPALVPVVGDPSTVQPYYQALPQYLESGGSLYERKALPDQTANPSHYTLLGTLVSADDPASETPDTGQFLIHSTNSTVWILSEPTPYFTQYDGAEQPSVLGQWREILPSDDWVRIVIRTAAKVQSADVERISFLDAYWIDAIIEVEPDSGEEIRISAAMLDPTEYPEAPYFDGSMGEPAIQDDFLWEGAENDSISWYYRQRLKRTRWLWMVLDASLPAGRPRQVYYHDYEHPYVPE